MIAGPLAGTRSFCCAISSPIPQQSRLDRVPGCGERIWLTTIQLMPTPTAKVTLVVTDRHEILIYEGQKAGKLGTVAWHFQPRLGRFGLPTSLRPENKMWSGHSGQDRVWNRVMNILIGDDHLLFREGLCRLLTQLDEKARFVEASTFDELLDLARGDQEFDLVLMDLQMPGFPGFAGVNQVCLQQVGTPVVIVSGSESQADVRAALDAGASGYIPKSSSVKIMLSALNLVFSGGVYVPPALLMGENGTVHMPGGTPPTTGPQAANGASPPVLTQRQRDVLRCLREGKSNKQIAFELGLSEGTVKIHVTAVMRSLGVRNRTQAVIASGDILNQ